MANYITTDTELTSVANAIRTKGGTSESLTYPAGFVTAIQNIPSGGGGGGAAKNDVTFYDYDGTIVDSYSASDFASLAALPANPSHEGLVAQGWNWSLADAKTYVASYGKLNIGQMYVTQSGATEIDVEMQEGRLEPTLTICVNGTVTVDWGDNTTPDTVTGTSLYTRLAVQHVYASESEYTISILATGNNKYKFYGTSTYTILLKNTSQNENRIYANTVKHIRIGNNAEIGSSAFYNCCSLSSITIPDSVTSIGDSVFYYCYSLSSITIPNCVTNIDVNTFYSCSSLSIITIPNSVTSIGASAFQSCSSLFSVTIPDDMTSIGNYAFQYCYSLSSITIPDSVTSIGGSVFYYCYSLSGINIPNGITRIMANEFYYCYSLSSITIPDGVTTIAASAFNSCYSFSSITIPDSVTSIGNSAFYNCYGIKEYHILPTTVPTGGTNMFYSIVSDCIIYVPKGHLTDYQTATNWSTYASYMQEEPT